MLISAVSKVSITNQRSVNGIWDMLIFSNIQHRRSWYITKQYCNEQTTEVYRNFWLVSLSFAYFFVSSFQVKGWIPKIEEMLDWSWIRLSWTVEQGNILRPSYVKSKKHQPDRKFARDRIKNHTASVYEMIEYTLEKLFLCFKDCSSFEQIKPNGVFLYNVNVRTQRLCNYNNIDFSCSIYYFNTCNSMELTR